MFRIWTSLEICRMVKSQPFSPYILVSTHQQQTAFENIVGKGEIAHNEQFLLFSQCSLLKQIIVCLFVHIFSIISLFAAEVEELENDISGKGLNSSTKKLKFVVRWKAT